jgi:ATP-dependent DNA helicase RecG
MMTTMIDFSPAQAADRIGKLLVAIESRTLEFKRIGKGQSSRMLYPPQYSLNIEAAVETVTLTLLNEERPAAWVQVSDWLDRNGPIANRHLR